MLGLLYILCGRVVPNALLSVERLLRLLQQDGGAGEVGLCGLELGLVRRLLELQRPRVQHRHDLASLDPVPQPDLELLQSGFDLRKQIQRAGSTDHAHEGGRVGSHLHGVRLNRWRTWGLIRRDAPSDQAQQGHRPSHQEMHGLHCGASPRVLPPQTRA